MKDLKKWLIACLVIGGLVLTACSSEDTPDEVEEIVMGFVPSSESDKIADTIEPLAEELSNVLGMPVRGQVMVDYSGLVEAMGSGNVHIGFLPAFGYVLGEERYDFEVILKSERNGSDSYRAQFVVREDSGIETIEDLEGKLWGFADVSSPAGYLFPAAHLAENYNVDDVEAFFGDAIQTGSNDGALITLYEEEIDVATTFEDARTVLLNDYPDVMDELKVIEYTGEIPNDTITVIPGLDAEMKADIKAAFLSFNENEDIIQIMNDIYRWDGIREAEDADYDIVRETYDRFRESISID
ncbi:phosphate/phosphite/phosphonate ABC transporter substrate-binding protein [Bacillus sp. FJAT-45037]|uniref:phosphate/phosphite/phosphonate ABC transporter substrate-binding protein n=1 Tax=Bacillus sp. FJAT-45037 TaxID=2011007 RepID=UPI002FCDDF64